LTALSRQVFPKRARIMPGDVFVWHGGMCLNGGARGKPARDQRLDVRGQRSVRRGKHGNGARELSVLDCLLMGCNWSWELSGQALPLAEMAGRNACPTKLCSFPSSIEAIAQGCLEQGPKRNSCGQSPENSTALSRQVLDDLVENDEA